MINSTQRAGSWNEIKGKLKQRYSMITDNDLLFADGRKDELIGRLQIKLGKTKEEIQKLISGL